MFTLVSSHHSKPTGSGMLRQPVRNKQRAFSVKISQGLIKQPELSWLNPHASQGNPAALPGRQVPNLAVSTVAQTQLF